MEAQHPRKKSPRAPSMSLEEAIDRVQRVYDREHLHPAPTEVIAQHLGYKGASNGSALSALASVRYFGLVERPRDGYLAVTKDFERFKFAPDERQRRSLLTGFLRKPVLYAELLDKYESALPSDANLRFELIERGFGPPAAEAALAAFRRSVDYASYYAGDESDHPSSSEGLNVDNVEDEHTTGVVLQHPSSNSKSESTLLRMPSEEEMDKIPVRLPGGRRAWLVIPTPFFASDKVRLKAQIDLLLTQDEEET